MSRLGCILILFLTIACTTTTKVAPSNQSTDPQVLHRQGVVRLEAGDFAGATDLFNQSLSIDSNYVDAYRGLAAVAYSDKKPKEALTYLQKANQKSVRSDPGLLYQLTKISWETDRYKLCQQTAQKFLESSPDHRRTAEVQKYARDASFLLNLTISTEDLATPMAGLNSPQREYLPSFPADEETVYFTRVVNNQEDFFVAKRDGDSWSEPQPLEGINTSQNEGAHHITVDGKTLLFTRCSDREGFGSCDLYFSILEDGSWAPPRNLGDQVNTPQWEAQPCLTSDGRRLYFSSSRPGGVGGRDIWYLDRTPSGWARAQNLVQINTPGNEEVPFIHPDGRSLYFMSDGHPGFGGSDLFYTDLGTADGEIVNLGAGLNTKKDDGALSISLDGTTAYFARDVQSEGAIDLDMYSAPLPLKVRSIPATYLRIQVVDALTEKPVEAEVAIEDLVANTRIGRYALDTKSKNLITLPAGTKFGVRISKPGYIFYSEHFDLSNATSALDPYLLDVTLQPIENVEAIKPVRLSNIFFSTGSAALLPTSNAEINYLANQLKEHPSMQIEIHGHTDNVGQPADNLALSVQRAEAVRQALLDQGIHHDRVKTKGFGETSPIASNETDEGRALNRRTEFLILQH